MKLKSASCQIVYWEGGRLRLRIANYLTRRTFAADPVTLDLIRNGQEIQKKVTLGKIE